MTDTVTFRIIEPHTPDADYHRWVFLPDYQGEPVTVRRTISGRGHRHAWRDWVVLICNNTECAGRAIVPDTLLTDVANTQDPVTSDD